MGRGSWVVECRDILGPCASFFNLFCWVFGFDIFMLFRFGSAGAMMSRYRSEGSINRLCYGSTRLASVMQALRGRSNQVAWYKSSSSVHQMLGFSWDSSSFKLD
jgi:hypothetical protein